LDGDKLVLVEEALARILGMLSDTDRLCLIVFNDRARRLCPLTRITASARASLRRLVCRLSASGGTDLGAALALAVAVLAGRRCINTSTACFLFTDGCDSTGSLQVRADNVTLACKAVTSSPALLPTMTGLHGLSREAEVTGVDTAYVWLGSRPRCQPVLQHGVTDRGHLQLH
jgi:Mg-chelatase subunit ChlD